LEAEGLLDSYIAERGVKEKNKKVVSVKTEKEKEEERKAQEKEEDDERDDAEERILFKDEEGAEEEVARKISKKFSITQKKRPVRSKSKTKQK
jgi:ATP-dependent helicase YprA (DUF1998 family)